MQATLRRNPTAALIRRKLPPVPSNCSRDKGRLSLPATQPGTYHHFSQSSQHTLSGTATRPPTLDQLPDHGNFKKPHLDTIYALSTAQGRAAIAVIRISGAACLQVRQNHRHDKSSRSLLLRYTKVSAPAGRCLVLEQQLSGNCMTLHLQPRPLRCLMPQHCFSTFHCRRLSQAKMFWKYIRMEGRQLSRQS